MANTDRQLAGPDKNLARLSIYGVVIIVLALLPLLVRSPYVVHVFIIAFIYIVATVSLRTVTISGQYPLARPAR